MISFKQKNRTDSNSTQQSIFEKYWKLTPFKYKSFTHQYFADKNRRVNIAYRFKKFGMHDLMKLEQKTFQVPAEFKQLKL